MENGIRKAEKKELNQADIDFINENIRKIPNFPKQGVLFYDLFSILNDVNLHQKLFSVSETLVNNFIFETNVEINAIVGLESRGFLIGLVLADRLKLPFVPVRKKNKLPGTLYKVNYVTEYSEDTLELQADMLNENSKVLIVDDLLATGGSMKAAEDLISLTKAQLAAYFVLFEIEKLDGKKKLSKPESLISMSKI